jgi:stage V sporulation protein B
VVESRRGDIVASTVTSPSTFDGRSSNALPPTVASDSATMFGLRLLYYATGFVASVLISRALGVEKRGLYYLPVVTAATVTAFGHLSIEQVNVYLLGTKRLSPERLWGQSGLVAAVMGPLCLIGLVVTSKLFPGFFTDTRPHWLWLAGLTIPFAIHTQLAAGLLTLRGDVTWQFKASLVASVAQLLLLGCFILTPWFGVDVVLGVYLAVTILTWGIMVSRFRGQEQPWLTWDSRLLGETLRRSLWLHAGSVLLFLHFRLDMLMVQGLAGVSALGIYSLAVTLAETILLVTGTLAIAILPRQMTRTVVDAARAALKGVRMNLVLGLVLALGWAVVGYPLILFAFGAEFAGTFLRLLTLLPGMVFLGLQRVCGGAVIRTDQPHRMVAINALSLACNAGLNFWWIPRWGPAGAGLASTLSYALGACLFLTWTSNLAETRGVSFLLPGREELAALWRGVRGVVARVGL